MVREDLIASAVAFLQDPSVAASPVDKRIAFLQSKNLTQEEIDISLARAEDGSAQQSTPAPASQNQLGHANSQQQMMRQPVGYGYGPYQGAPWGHPPPEPPSRDWRDWFIMATVTSGVSYGLYVVAKRYIMPLIAPPTPPQIEQDKASIDESFTRAFTLIDQLAADTATLKATEVERTEKLDSTLRDVDAVIADLKTAKTRQENESRNIADQVQGLKDLVPKALEGWKESGDKRLEELGAEMRSLKKLLNNRVGGSSGPSSTHPSTPRPNPNPNPTAPTDQHHNSRASTPTGAAANGIATAPQPSDDNKMPTSLIPSAPAPGVTVPRRETPSVFQGSSGGGRAAIPAWQMAAAASGGSGGSGGGGKKGDGGGAVEAGT